MDNGSTDRTPEIAAYLSRTPEGVRLCALYTRRKRARRPAPCGCSSPAAVVAYMDVDLSTGREALLPLLLRCSRVTVICPSGGRLARGSEVIRGPKRELISRCYNLMVRALVHNNFLRRLLRLQSHASGDRPGVASPGSRQCLPFLTRSFWSWPNATVYEFMRCRSTGSHCVERLFFPTPPSLTSKGLGRLVREFGRGGGDLRIRTSFGGPANSLPACASLRKVGLFTTVSLFRPLLPSDADHGGVRGERGYPCHLHGHEYRGPWSFHVRYPRPRPPECCAAGLDHLLLTMSPTTLALVVASATRTGARCWARHCHLDRHRDRNACPVPPLADLDLPSARGVNPDEYTQLAEDERTYWWNIGRLSIIETYLRRNPRPAKAHSGYST